MTFTRNLRTFALLSTAVLASSAFASTISQEVWAGPQPVISSPSLSPAEVQADWLLWKQMGLDAYTQGDGNYGDQRSYDTQLKQYQQQRNSQKFSELVQSIQADTK